MIVSGAAAQPAHCKQDLARISTGWHIITGLGHIGGMSLGTWMPEAWLRIETEAGLLANQLHASICITKLT